MSYNFKLDPCPLCGKETEIISDCITCKCGYILDTIAVLDDRENTIKEIAERNRNSGIVNIRKKRQAFKEKMGL